MGKMILPNEGLDAWVDVAVNLTHKMGLIKSAIDVTKDTTLADLEAIESTFPGYERRQIINWTPAILTGDVARAIAQACVWTFSGGPGDEEDIYGYFVVQTAMTKCLLVQVFDPDPPVTIDVANPEFVQVPGFGLFSQYTD